jgi:hypothetical protein
MPLWIAVQLLKVALVRTKSVNFRRRNGNLSGPAGLQFGPRKLKLTPNT